MAGPSTSHARLGDRSAAEEGVDWHHVQCRIACFARLIFVTALVFLVCAAILHHSHEGTSLVELSAAPGITSLLVVVVISLVIWLTCRRESTLALPWLTFADVLALVGPCAAVSVMAYRGATTMIVFSALLAVALIVVGRAVMVPSAASRTAWMSLIAVAPLTAVAFHVAHLRAATEAPVHAADPTAFAHHVILEATLWCGAAVAMATYTSQVIYGLHREVREAKQLGQYVLERKLGEGGMGRVYLARHTMLRRPTAIKLLAPDKMSERHLERFAHEVRVTSELTHPNTISIFDYGRTPEGVFYYVMEYLEGVDMERLGDEDGHQPARRVIHLLEQACGALAEAHDAGLIHRDIKPANMILTRLGGIHDFVKVLDFGLVKEVGGGEAGLTGENVITGTPLYMSPEAIKAPSAVDARSDIYALGCVAYYLLTGTTVFTGDSVVEICSHHLHTSPQPPSERLAEAVPGDLEALVMECLEKDPKARPQHAADLRERLLACADAGTWTSNEARSWWDRSGALFARVPSDRPTSGATVVVDLKRRAAAGA